MAQRISVVLEDDLDGSPADGTISFALDGRNYEIDLNNNNADRLRAAFRPFTAAGRRSKSRTARTGKSRTTVVDPVAVRKWAQSNGIAVSARGRISADVIERFKAAGN